MHSSSAAGLVWSSGARIRSVKESSWTTGKTTTFCCPFEEWGLYGGLLVRHSWAVWALNWVWQPLYKTKASDFVLFWVDACLSFGWILHLSTHQWKLRWKRLGFGVVLYLGIFVLLGVFFFFIYSNRLWSLLDTWLRIRKPIWLRLTVLSISPHSRSSAVTFAASGASLIATIWIHFPGCLWNWKQLANTRTEQRMWL